MRRRYQLVPGRQRLMKFPPNLVPQKAIASDLCVSLVTLWRARQSGIPDFPAPVVIRNMIFWRKEDVPKLEDALMRFEGRCKLEQRRTGIKRNATLLASRPKLKRPGTFHRPDERQQDLF